MTFTTKAGLPVLTTAEVKTITQTTAICGGNVTSDSGSTVTARGVCWSTGHIPTVSDTKTTNGSGTGSFTSNIIGLTPGTTYYVRAYATNSKGTGYGSAMSFRTADSSLPTVTTTAVSTITSVSAQSGGNVTSDGGATVTARGVCWSTGQTPTVLDDKTTDGTGTGSFTSDITGLTPGTTYYVRAYATNSVGTGYGSSRSFTVHETGTVTDTDGNVYQTVKIGSQWWMAENLRVTHYRNGDAIPNVTDNTEWSNLTTGAYCNYDNYANNADTFGSLYNWYAVSDSRNIAPEGWHVPSDDDWKTLEMYLGMSQSEADGIEWRGTDEGSKLKSTSGWYSDGNGTDDYGFSAPPGGIRFYDGHYGKVGYEARFWSSTESDSYGTWNRALSYVY